MNDDLTLRAMLKQEETCYRVDDYFRKLPTPSPEMLPPVDPAARQQIVQWYMSIMDACDFPKEVAAVSMSCLDRFVSSTDGSEVLLSRSQYQLASLTALYTSVKIHCPQALSPDLVAKLSHGAFGADDVEAMERKMLKALQWRVNPPTVMDFVRVYLDMLATSFSDTYFDQRARTVIMELVGYQANLSVLDFDLSINKASHIAMASLWNAIESIYPNDMMLCEIIHDFVIKVSDIDHLDLETLQQKLYEAVTVQNDIKSLSEQLSACDSPVNKRMHRNSFVDSPRSVYEQNEAGGVSI